MHIVSVGRLSGSFPMSWHSFLPTAQYFLYAFAEEADTILYVGRTGALWHRLVQHRKSAAFWGLSYELWLVPFTDKAALIRAEAEHIRPHRPRYNLQDW